MMSNTITVDVKSIPAPVADAHCRTLLHILNKFYDDPKNQAEFEAWYLERYGKPCTDASYMR